MRTFRENEGEDNRRKLLVIAAIGCNKCVSVCVCIVCTNINCPLVGMKSPKNVASHANDIKAEMTNLEC